MYEETTMTEKESIDLIASMINKAKNSFNENGFLYLMYGWVIFICCMVQFIGLYFFKSQDVYFIWYLTWAAVIYQVIYLRKKRNREKTRTYTDEIIGFVWLVFIVCIALLVFIQIYLKSLSTINPSILVMYGMPTILSGVILKSNPLKMGGVCCWALALISPFVNIEFQSLLIAAAVIAAWIIPGYLLKQKFKKEN